MLSGNPQGSVFVQDNVLHIQGTDSADVIVTKVVAGISSPAVQITINSVVQNPIALSQFTSAEIDLLGGDDSLELNLPVQATLSGGDGADTLDLSASTEDLGIDQQQIATSTGTYFYGGFEKLLSGSGNDNIDIFTFNISDDVSASPLRYIDGGAGNDTIVYFDGAPDHSIAPTVHGGAGDDTLSVDRDGGEINGTTPHSAGPAYYFGDDGNDSLIMQRTFANRDFQGGAGIDTVDYSEFSTVGGILVTLDDKTGDGPRGFDNVHSDVEVVIGTQWNDTLIGSNHSETLDGSTGNDSIVGNGGNDSIIGDEGDDTILGGAGDDTLLGNNGNDSIIGGDGTDVMNGGAGINVVLEDLPQSPPPAPVSPFALTGGIFSVHGTSGDDQIIVRLKSGDAGKIEAVLGSTVQAFTIAGITSIFVDAGTGNDRIDLSTISIASKIYARAGNDVIFGSKASDRVYGGDGNDWIGGSSGNDILYGEAGNDRIFGGDGRDYIDSGAGLDVVRGDLGIDRLYVKIGSDDFRNNAGDLITLVAT